MTPDSNTPQRLSIVASQFGLTAAALRTEAKRGRLVISRVAGKDWTSVAAVREMFEKCRVTPVDHTYGSDRHAIVATPPSGLSETEDTSTALASALATVDRLKRRSRLTSLASMSRRAANAA